MPSRPDPAVATGGTARKVGEIVGGDERQGSVGGDGEKDAIRFYHLATGREPGDSGLAEHTVIALLASGYGGMKWHDLYDYSVKLGRVDGWEVMEWGGCDAEVDVMVEHTSNLGNTYTHDLDGPCNYGGPPTYHCVVMADREDDRLDMQWEDGGMRLVVRNGKVVE